MLMKKGNTKLYGLEKKEFCTKTKLKFSRESMVIKEFKGLHLEEIFNEKVIVDIL